MSVELVKYNFGCGPNPKEGYVNVDGFEWAKKPDILHDLTKIPYYWAKSSTASEIVAIEVLEHISWRETLKVLKEWYDILAPNGKLHVQVPDCGKMMEYYPHLICECVPHKDASGEFKADDDCIYCQGSAKVNPTRWYYAFVGAQKHTFDVHKNIFTVQSLAEVLKLAGFKNLTFSEDPNKIKVDAYKL